MARLKTKGVVVDTVQLKAEMREIARTTRQEVTELSRQALRAQVDAINAAAHYRRTNAEQDFTSPLRLSSGTVDRPLKGARVVVRERRSAAGTRGARLVAFVSHKAPSGANVFNVLDAGSKPRVAKTRFTFPMYEGNTTPISSGEIEQGDPDIIRSRIVRGNVRLKRDERGNLMAFTAREGSVIAGIPARNFYKSVALWVESQLVRREIVNASRRSKYRLKKDDVRITVPDRPRFNT